MSTEHPTPLAEGERDILLIVHRTNVTEVAQAINEDRSNVDHVLKGRRTSGKAVRRIQAKLEKHFALKPGLLAVEVSAN